MEDIILYDPEVNQIGSAEYTQYMKAGNHKAMIADVEVLEKQVSKNDEEYQAIQIQWVNEFNEEIRQRLTIMHEGSTKKDEAAQTRARKALNITAKHMHDLGVCFGQEGLVGLNDIKTKFAKRWVAIAVRQGNDKFREVKQIRTTVDMLERFVEPAVEAAADDVPFAQSLKNLIPKG